MDDLTFVSVLSTFGPVNPMATENSVKPKRPRQNFLSEPVECPHFGSAERMEAFDRAHNDNYAKPV